MKSALETSPRKEKTPHEHFPREGALLTSHNHKSAASRQNHCAVCFQTEGLSPWQHSHLSLPQRENTF